MAEPSRCWLRRKNETKQKHDKERDKLTTCGMCVVERESNIIDLRIWNNVFYVYFLQIGQVEVFFFLRAFHTAATHLTKQEKEQVFMALLNIYIDLEVIHAWLSGHVQILKNVPAQFGPVTS